MKLTRTAPEQAIQHSLEDMKPGEIAYTLPWALNIGLDGSGTLNGKYPAEPCPHGTVSMRVGLLPDGFLVELPTSYTYTKRDHTNWATLPVVGFVSSGELLQLGTEN